MMTIATIGAHNDHAASLMMEGHLEEAKTTLLGCLGNVKHCLEEARSHVESRTTSLQHPNSRHVAVAARSSLSDIDMELWQHSTSYIYKRPLRFSDVAKAPEFAVNDHVFMGTMLSATIVFNLALIQHTLARMGSPQALTKAQQLYTMVASLTSCKSINRWNSYQLDVHLVSLNNLSQLFLEQQNYLKARNVVSSLQSIMSTIIPSHRSSFLESSELDSILGNVDALHAMNISKGPCAPAA